MQAGEFIRIDISGNWIRTDAPGRGKLSYRISRTEACRKMQIDLSAPSPLDVRIGPFNRRPSGTARINGENVPLNPYRSGDSWWCMICRLHGNSFVIETELT